MQAGHRTETVTITATDGMDLGGTLFPAGDADTTLLVHGATAVPHRFYRRIARFFQRKGWTVLTYDFRGVGASRPESLRGFRGKASDWGLLDMPAALDWVKETQRSRRIFFLGHSAGGQQAGLLDNPAIIDAMVTVSSQSGYWRYQRGSEKLNVLVLVTIVLPLVARMVGYLPWSRLGSGEDLPKEAAIEWARWCRSPRYILGDHSLPLGRFREFRAPVLAYSVDDDKWGTARSVDAMMSAYPNVERHHIVPAAYGLASLGHMGFFREGSEPLWEQTFAWLNRQSPGNAVGDGVGPLDTVQ